MMWTDVVVLLIFLWKTCNSDTVGFVQGPCDSSTTSDIQCRWLNDINQLTEMMDKARQTVSLATFGGAHIQAIYIFYCKFRQNSLPPDIFRNTGVKYLEIGDTPLEGGITQSSTGRAFVGTGSSIQWLRISKCKLPIYGWTDMSNLQNLYYLGLPRNGIKEISNLLFSRPPQNLKTLQLYSNEITSLADKAFNKLTNLEIINLSNNKLQTLKRSMFATPAMHLKVIYLAHNEIKYLPEDIFSEMPKLNEIDLNNNQLTILGEKTWSLVWSQLSRVFLDDNKWTCTCKIMGWLLRPNVKQNGQIITGKCTSQFLTEGKPIEDLTNLDLACDLDGELS